MFFCRDVSGKKIEVALGQASLEILSWSWNWHGLVANTWQIRLVWLGVGAAKLRCACVRSSKAGGICC